MPLTLARKAYEVGTYTARRNLGPLDPTNEQSSYENIFDVEMKDGSGNPFPMEVKSVTKKAQVPKQLHFEIQLSGSIENGSITFTNRNNALLRGNTSPDNVFFDDSSFGGITAEASGTGATLEEINKFSAPTMKSATMLTMLVSLSSSIALIKIFQMMDYMLFFNVSLPPIFAKYLEIFSTNFFNDFPNLMIMFVDENCAGIKPKF